MLSVIGIHLIFHDYHDNPRSDHFFMACAAIDLQWGDLGHGPETRIRILCTDTHTPYRVCIQPWRVYCPDRGIGGSKVTRPGNLISKVWISPEQLTNRKRDPIPRLAEVSGG